MSIGIAHALSLITTAERRLLGVTDKVEKVFDYQKTIC